MGDLGTREPGRRREICGQCVAGGGGEPGSRGAQGQKRTWGQLAVGDLGTGGLVLGIPRERGAGHGGDPGTGELTHGDTLEVP